MIVQCSDIFSTAMNTAVLQCSHIISSHISFSLMDSILLMASHSQAAPSTFRHSCAEELITIKKQTVNSYSLQGVGQREDC